MGSLLTRILTESLDVLCKSPPWPFPSAQSQDQRSFCLLCFFRTHISSCLFHESRSDNLFLAGNPEESGSLWHLTPGCRLSHTAMSDCRKGLHGPWRAGALSLPPQRIAQLSFVLGSQMSPWESPKNSRLGFQQGLLNWPRWFLRVSSQRHWRKPAGTSGSAQVASLRLCASAGHGRCVLSSEKGTPSESRLPANGRGKTKHQRPKRNLSGRFPPVGYSWALGISPLAEASPPPFSSWGGVRLSEVLREQENRASDSSTEPREGSRPERKKP